MHQQQFISIPPQFRDGNFRNYYTPAELLGEPNLMQCSPEFVVQRGGSITQSALSQIESTFDVIIRVGKQKGLSAIIDVQVQKLNPNQYPEIPGWHCDYVPRSKYSGEPDFGLVHSNAFHVGLSLSSEPQGVCQNEFVGTPIQPKIWDNEHVYEDLHRQVSRINPETVKQPDGRFTWYNQKTVHRVTPCIRRGIRMYLRYSMLEKPPVLNQVVNQTQVYMLKEENGW